MWHWRDLFCIIHWRVENRSLFEHWQYVKCQKFQLKLNIHQWTVAILSNVNTDATLFPMSNGFVSTGAPHGAGLPHRNRSSAVRGRGNVIRPTRCTDQGTSYCFTNLLLPHKLFFFRLRGWGVCVCVEGFLPMSLQWDLRFCDKQAYCCYYQAWTLKSPSVCVRTHRHTEV